MKVCKGCKKLKNIKEYAKEPDGKDGHRNYCKECIKKAKEIKAIKMPWIRIWYWINSRCNDPNRKDYKYYGGKGIINCLTIEDVKYLWFRDKAYLMIKPSIDRENNDGNYDLGNCQFLEL